MADFDQLLSQHRNALLGPQRRTTGDIIRAGIQATTGTPYGEALASIDAQRFDRALRGYQVLSAERDFQTRRDQMMWQRAQAEADRGDENAARLLELAGAYGANAAEAQRLAAAVVARTETDNIDDASALPGLVAEEAEKLGLQARPELTLMSTAGGGVTGIDPLGRAQTIVAGQTEAPTPYTDIGKINADLERGLITPAQALQAARGGDDRWRALTDEERASYGIPENQPAQISPDGKVQTIGSAGISIYDPETGNMVAQVGGVPLTGSQAGKQAIEISDEIRQTNTRLSELDTALRNLRENPEAAGLSGLLIENVGGLAQQLTDLAGIDREWLPTAPVQQTRTELASLLGQYIPTITGDESGRYSDQDMRRAQAALPASRATASFAQVESALLTLQDIEERSRMRVRMRADGFAPEIDITYPDGQMRYAQQLMREGMTLEEAGQIIADLFVKYGVSPDVVGIQ